jgi:outer membrane protein assembly factor BamA
MGGSTSYPGYGLAGDDLFELMRGYPAGFFRGSGGYLLNLEYRVALFKIEKAFFLSRGLERVYLNLFTDVGNLWVKEREINPAFSIGAELSLALLIGDFRFVLSGGIAVGRNPHHDPVVYFRIGNSF